MELQNSPKVQGILIKGPQGISHIIIIFVKAIDYRYLHDNLNFSYFPVVAVIVEITTAFWYDTLSLHFLCHSAGPACLGMSIPCEAGWRP